MPYPFVFRDRHPFILLDGREYLLDTGCPFSFSFEPERQETVIGGEVCVLQYPTEEICEGVRRCFGQQTAGLIGLDTFEKFGRVLMDRENGEVSFGREACCREGAEELPLALTEPCLILAANVNGQSGRRVLLNTACGLDYFTLSLLKKREPVGECGDYSPVYGQMLNPLYPVRFAVGGCLFSRSACAMPAEMEADMRESGGIEGCLGLGSFFPAEGGFVLLDLQNKKLCFRKNRPFSQTGGQ